MNSFFLKIKHWQFFSISYLVPALAYFFIMFRFMSTMMSRDIEAVENIFDQMWIMMPLMILSYLLMFGWMWSVVVGLRDKVLQYDNFKIKWFKRAIVFTLIYYIVFSIAFMYMFFNINVDSFVENDGFPRGFFIFFLLTMPLHLLATFCAYYCMYFVAKTYKTLERRQPLSFGEFVGEFFLIWFLPIGIWFLQPKINKWCEENIDEDLKEDQ